MYAIIYKSTLFFSFIHSWYLLITKNLWSSICSYAPYLTWPNSIFYFSDPPRHRAHGQVSDPCVWIPGERPEAVHGWLRGHPCHKQCQALPIPGIVFFYSSVLLKSIFFTWRGLKSKVMNDKFTLSCSSR